MSTRTEATVEDLYRVSENAKAELVNGEIVLMSPTGLLPSFAAGRIYISLALHAERTGVGHAFPDNTGYIVELPNRKSFSPDVSYYHGPLTMGFGNGAPVLAVEVRSEGDYGPAALREMAAKRADYFAAGTLVAWDVDLDGDDVIRSFRAEDPEMPLVFRRGEIAQAEPALTGWTMPVDDLWPR